MTTIIGNLQQGCLMADKYVVKTIEHTKSIRGFNRTEETKLKINEDKTFAYVFDFEQNEAFIPLILNYLTRFENKTLDKDEPELIYDTESKIRLYVLSKRHLYSVFVGTGKKSKCNITLISSWVDNCDISYRTLEQFPEFTVFDYFDAIIMSQEKAMTGNYDIVYQKQLKLIPIFKKPTTKKTKGKKKS